MTALASFSVVAPIRVPDDSIANLTALNVAWPNNVPSTETSIVLMYDPARLPVELREPTLELLRAFTEQNLSMPPEGLGVEEWLKALGITWRLKAAAALARQARAHDERGLQSMFDEAAGTRAWLLGLANDPGFPGQLEAQALRGLLQAAWGEVLENAPPPPGAAPQRPSARTGLTGLHRQPIAPAKRSAPTPRRAASAAPFEPVGSTYKVRNKFLFVVLAAVVAARIFLVEPDLKVPDQAKVAEHAAPGSRR